MLCLFMASALLSLLRGLVWTIAALYFTMTASVWLATLRTLGLSSLRRCPSVLRLSLRGSQIRDLCVVILLPFLALSLARALGVGDRLIAQLPVGPFALIGSLCLSLLLVPPTVLVLSSSTDEQVRWALTLKNFIGWRRVVSMLDTGYMAVAPRAGDLWSVTLKRSATLPDVLRTSGAQGWQVRVKELIDLSPIVVVDARTFTPALLFEASAALARRNCHKALFVCEEDGYCPLLEHLLADGHVSPCTPVNVVREGRLGPLLARLVVKPDTLPKPDGFISNTMSIAEAVSQSGLAHQNSSHGRLQKDQPVTLSGKGGRRRLSTTLTPFWRLTALGAAVSLLLTTGLAPLAFLAPHLHAPFGFNVTVLRTLLVCNWVGCAIYLYLAHSLTEVCICDDTLLISDSSKRSDIHLSQVSSVAGPDWTTLRRITLHLNAPSPFGKRIIFAGRLFTAGTDARELRRRLYLYAEQKGAGLHICEGEEL
jgi:hypothetical protein